MRFWRRFAACTSCSEHVFDLPADIWSLGITALELSLGHAPNCLFPPAKVLSKTILDAPPQLDREGGRYKYSKAMKDMVESCLNKDPKKRCASSLSFLACHELEKWH